MIQVIYNGVDITGDVSVNRCVHDMYTAGQSDTLAIRFNDVHHLWGTWAPYAGDEIRVDFEDATTGTMFLTSVRSRNGMYDLVAQSAPKSGYTRKRKAWQQVKLLQIGEEIAGRNGLEFSSYGVTDHLYPYILQDDMGDFAFLNGRARLDGCAFQVFDKRLVMYSEPYMEAVDPAEVLELPGDSDYEYRHRLTDLYGSCEVNSGLYSGSFAIDNGSTRVYRPDVAGGVSNKAEADRFAKGLLRSVNKDCMTGFVRVPVMTKYAAGSTVWLANSRDPSFDGTIFLDHIRNDYSTGKSKIFFRKPLEGY